VILPAHAELTDGSGSSGGDATTTPAPLNYFDTDLPMNIQYTRIDKPVKDHLFTTVADMLIPEAHAIPPTLLGGMSVIIKDNSANIRFLSQQKTNIHNVVAPIDGSASGKPVLESGACKTPSGGPQSAQLIDYTPGNSTVLVRIISSGKDAGASREVVVPMNPIGSLIVKNCL